MLKRYLARRLLVAIPSLIIASAIVFTLPRLIPGDAVQLMLAETSYAKDIDELRAKLGLDRALAPARLAGAEPLGGAGAGGHPHRLAGSVDAAKVQVGAIAADPALPLVRVRTHDVPKTLWTDGSIAALAVTAVSAAIVFETALDAAEGQPLAVATSLAYPLTDLVLIGVFVGALAST